jgi:DNA-binding response OmpR family regulator
MGRRILVVDDTPETAAALKTYLSSHGFGVVVAHGGSDARLLAVDSPPDLVLTDADMPDLDGPSLCKALKKDPRTAAVPVIIMSGTLVEDDDVVAGLEVGADDYLTKPFPMKVMLARVQAVLRRYAPTPDAARVLKRGGLELDPAGRAVTLAGKPVKLTRKEFDLLALLIEKEGRVLTPAFLLEAVWGYDLSDYNDPQTVTTHVFRLRKKIGAQRIENVTGHGYKFVP